MAKTKKLKRGFTLVELLIVLSVVAVFCSIGFPVLASAKTAARETTSIQQLRQIHLGLMLYRSEYDGDGVYGSATDMGLPINDRRPAFTKLSRVPLNLWTSPCGLHPSEGIKILYPVYYFPSDDPPSFAKQSTAYQDNLILAFDMECSPSESDIYSHYLPKLGLGVLLSGTARRVRGLGNQFEPAWWAPPAN